MTDHAAINRDHWNATAGDWVAEGERLWQCAAPQWGIWGLPEAELQMLPAEMAGIDAIELGCGTGYVSGWMARRGARATGIDISARQLATARRLAVEDGVALRLVQGNAEALPFADGSFDFAISEYGAAIWCDPAVWLREAFRVLRPGGRLVFLGHHAFVTITTPQSGAACEAVLHRPYRGLGAVDWRGVEVDPGGIEFALSFEVWLRLFREIGFAVAEYRELYAPEDASGEAHGIPADWARRYPAEQVWKLAKPG